VDGTTARAIRDGGVDPRKALERNESYKALSAGGALLFIGPTGNNVNDLRVATVRATEADEGVHP
jgi:hydroxypyruvate reductase